MNIDLMDIIPLLLLALGGVCVFCLGAFGNARSGILWGVTLAVALGAGVAELWTANSGRLGGNPAGPYSTFFTLLLIAVTTISLLFLYRYGRQRNFAGDELYGMMLFAALGAILTATTDSWLVFFLGFELLSLSLYVLIGVHRVEPAANEAGLKYFVMGSVAGAFIAFGLAVLYGATGTLSMSAGFARLSRHNDTVLVLVSYGFLLTGLGFKLSIVPFHLWAADVYQGAPAPITAFLSTASKVAVFAALTRIFLITPEPVREILVPIFWVLSALTMTVGNIAALRQKSLKRRLAYSSVAQMGYLLMALMAVRQEGLRAVLFYLAVYAVMDLGAFGVLGSFSDEGGDRDSIEDYRGLGYLRPYRSGIMTLCLLSLAGLPPTAGFIGKFLVFSSAFAAGYIVLSVIGICTVVIGLFYYMDVTVQLYMKPQKVSAPVAASGFPDWAAWTLVAVSVLFLGIVPSPLLSGINGIVSAVLTAAKAIH